MIIDYQGKKPEIHPSVFLAPTGVVIGDVAIGQGSSVWFGTVLRGDINCIRIGRRVNLQDMVMVHVDEPDYPTTVGDDVTIGHGAVVHGCTVGDRCLIGMGSVVLSGSKIGEGSIVAAGCVVMQNKVIPPRSLVAGMPGKVLRAVTEKEIEGILDSARRYAELAGTYRKPGSGGEV